MAAAQESHTGASEKTSINLQPGAMMITQVTRFPKQRRLPFLLASSLWILASVARGQVNVSNCLQVQEPAGLAVDDNSRLFVLDSLDGVTSHDAVNGTFLSSIVSIDADGGLAIVDNSMYIAPGSGTGVSSRTNTTVGKYDLSGTLLLALTSEGYDVAVDSDGDVYVSQYDERGVDVFNGTTGLAKYTILEDTFVLGIAFGPDGLLYASLNADDEVRKYEESNSGNFTLVEIFISGSTGSRVRTEPFGLAINQDDYLLYVCWSGSNEVTEYSEAGAEVRWWYPGTNISGSTIGGDSSSANDSQAALSPRYVALDNAGDIYVSVPQNGDSGTGEVYKYNGTSSGNLGRLSTCFVADDVGTVSTPSPVAANISSPSPVTDLGTTAPTSASDAGDALPTPETPSPATSAPQADYRVIPSPDDDLDTPAPTTSEDNGASAGRFLNPSILLMALFASSLVPFVAAKPAW